MPTTTTTATSPLTETNGVATINGAESWLDVVRERLDGLRYGVIQIVVHDGRVTQVECTEKVRFDGGRSRETGR